MNSRLKHFHFRTFHCALHQLSVLTLPMPEALPPPDPNYEPTESEVMEYAEYLGMDPVDDADLLWIAKEGINAPLPDGWTAYKHHAESVYYFNHLTQESYWEHPLDAHFKEKYLQEKEKKQAKAISQPLGTGSASKLSLSPLTKQCHSPPPLEECVINSPQVPRYSIEVVLSLRSTSCLLPPDVEMYIKNVLELHQAAAARRPSEQRRNTRGGRGGRTNHRISHSRQSHSHLPKAISRSACSYDFQEQQNKVKQDPLLATLKEVTGLLNKLSQSNKAKIFSSIIDIFKKQHPCSKTLSDEMFAAFKFEFVNLLFDKAVMEPPFVDLYSQLCLTLTKEFPGLSGVLIRKCQFHFEKYFVTDSSLSDEIDELIEKVKRDRFIFDGYVPEAQLDDERLYRENQLKAKVLGNLRFVASLILFSVIPPGAVSAITKQLVQNFQKPMAIQSLVTLWTKLLESAGINEYIETVVAKYISEFSKSMDIPVKERCLCANWMVYFKENQREQARKGGLLTSDQATSKKSEDGFVAVALSKKGSKARLCTDEHAQKFVENLDKMGLTALFSEFYKLQLSEPNKITFVADVLFHFTNLNKPLLRDQFQSIMVELLKDKNGLTKHHVAAGFFKFCKDGKFDDLLEDSPKAGEFLAPILSNWLELGIVNREQLVDCLVGVNLFNLSDLITAFVDYRKQNGLDYEWLEKNVTVCDILLSY
ncbi:hypothetical protein GEMRC1_001417 [Eukaryota sp. GEM-RC1]